MLQRGQSLPGLVITIVSVTGGSRPDGSFQPQDRPAVTFRIATSDGRELLPNELTRASVLVSGPTENYQRVISSQADVITASVGNEDGSWTYTLPALPEAYLPPYNDTPSFGSGDGELAGGPLVPGTYTLGFRASRDYMRDGESLRDTGNEAFNFLMLGATSLESREVVSAGNCTSCHGKLAAHGGGYNDVRMCVLCHTAGAEDRNVPDVAGGTPGVTIEFGVMIHKLHTASNLPSVLGVGAGPDGTLDYSLAPRPYELVGYGDQVFDFSHFSSPLMPSAYSISLYDKAGATYVQPAGNGPLPRDVGYASLPAAAREAEDKIRSGLVDCARCHGDPDGAGSLPAPTQGHLAETNSTRRACGSCHDDVDWSRPYTANGQTMGPQPDDTLCITCHEATATWMWPVREGHLHPYSNPVLNTGVNILITGISGGSSAGTHQAGDNVEVTFSVKDDAGNDLDLYTLQRFQWMVTGPTTNPQVVVPTVGPFDVGFRKGTPMVGNGSVSGLSVAASAQAQTIAIIFTSATTFDVVGSLTTAVTGTTVDLSGTTAVTYQGVSFTITGGTTAFAAQDRFYFDVRPKSGTYTERLPQDFAWELLGRSTGQADVLTVGNTPLMWGRHAVYERTAIQPGAALTQDAPWMLRSVVADSAAMSLASGDKVVIDEGTAYEEYLEVGWVETTDATTGADLGPHDRIWFRTVTRYEHTAGASIQEVTLSARGEGTAYAVTSEANGQITSVAGAFAAGNPVVISYRSHARFGSRRHAGDSLQEVFGWAAADSEDVGVEYGDWKGLSLLEGTYTVGAWVNRDFTVSPTGALQAKAESFQADETKYVPTDNTTYRMISPPATRTFLYGSSTELSERRIIDSGQSCNNCHGDLQAHGNGRRGLDTCLMCHATPGMEDGPKSTFASWYVGPTPGRSMEFRSLIHKLHAGKELSQREDYVVNGVFLGVPYPVTYEQVGYPRVPGGTADCASCHGAENATWYEPTALEHPEGGPVRSWAVTCGSCHDSIAAEVHIELSTLAGFESCASCHGEGRAFSVEWSHQLP
jgi:hypothetical protein